MLTPDSIANEVRAARIEAGGAAPVEMVETLIPVLMDWIKRSGVEFANASDAEGDDLDPDESEGAARRGRRRRPRGGRRRNGNRHAKRQDRNTRRRLTSGLHRSCLATLGVPPETVEAIVPTRPHGLGEWLKRIGSIFTRVFNGPPVPTEYVPHNEASMVVVGYVRQDLRLQPDDLRALSESMRRGDAQT